MPRPELPRAVRPVARNKARLPETLLPETAGKSPRQLPQKLLIQLKKINSVTVLYILLKVCIQVKASGEKNEERTQPFTVPHQPTLYRETLVRDTACGLKTEKEETLMKKVDFGSFTHIFWLPLWLLLPYISTQGLS